MNSIVPLLGGLVLLVIGGDMLVRGAVRVASGLGVSPLVIGLTLVGFGTSTPELVTSVQAALIDAPGIAYGNIVGSNIANILLILGISAMLYPIAVTSSALRRDGMIMIGVAVVFAVITLFIPMTRLVGAVFMLALIGYVVLAFLQERRSVVVDHGAAMDKGLALQSADPATAPGAVPSGGYLVPIGLTIGGLVLVVVGGSFLVDGAVTLARDFGIAETVIGLTIVAVGTSLPELVTSVMAAIRKQGDVAFGNIVGSNIYNILGIGGATALIAPGTVPQQIVQFDNPVMVAVSVIVIILAWTGFKLSRWEGAVLIGGYIAYVYAIWP